jgi:hypothetical protein
MGTLFIRHSVYIYEVSTGDFVRRRPAHVARVWPPRKRDFRWKPSRFRAQTAIAGISVNGGRAPTTFNFRSAATFAAPQLLPGRMGTQG